MRNEQNGRGTEQGHATNVIIRNKLCLRSLNRSRDVLQVLQTRTLHVKREVGDDQNEAPGLLCVVHDARGGHAFTRLSRCYAMRYQAGARSMLQAGTMQTSHACKVSMVMHSKASLFTPRTFF